MRVLSILMVTWLAMIAVTADAHPGSPRNFAHYDLSITVSGAQRRIAVEGSVQLPARTVESRAVELTLSNRMQMPSVSARVDDASAPGRLTLIRDDSASSVYRFSFDRPVAPSQTIRLDFSYSGAGEIATQFYIGPEVSFASAYGADWYPLLTDNEGVATARLDFTIPPGDTAIATGVRDGFADREGDGHFEFIVEQPTLFAFAAGRFMVTPGPQGSPIDLDGRPPVSVEFDPDYRILRRPAPGEPGG